MCSSCPCCWSFCWRSTCSWSYGRGSAFRPGCGIRRLFVFVLLKYSPGSLESVGVALLPRLFLVFLFLLPFLDRGLRRSPRYRPISTAVATLSVVAVAFLTWRAVQTTPPALADDRASR